MKAYSDWNKEDLLQEKANLENKWKEYCAQGFQYDMSRGRPCTEQLDLSNEMLDVVSTATGALNREGLDCRNYGVVDGMPQAKEMLADIMETRPENVIVFGNSSLNVMYDVIAKNMLRGVCGGEPWFKQEKVKFICPVPGYDRHFSICEFFGIEMINVDMTPEGPDMDQVEPLVESDPAIKGIWVVPKYSNPQGISCSDEVVRRFARLKPAAEDFRIFWDNAYCIHDIFEDKRDDLLDLIEECKKVGNPDLVYEFCSTSKISFPGAGIAGMATSDRNKSDIREALTKQTIGPDKINQLRHVRFFKDKAHLTEHMKKHAAIIRPKFELFLNRFKEEQLEELGVGSWIRPNGGYFIAYEAPEGCATEIIRKAKEAGMVMTPAGAPFPYHKDPKDSVIRIAPTLPPMKEIEVCVEIFIVCAKLTVVEKVLESC